MLCDLSQAVVSVLAEHGNSVLTPQWCLALMELISHCFICCPLPSVLSIQLMSEVSEQSLCRRARLSASVAVWSVSKYLFFLFIGCGLVDSKKLLNITVRPCLTL